MSDYSTRKAISLKGFRRKPRNRGKEREFTLQYSNANSNCNHNNRPIRIMTEGSLDSYISRLAVFAQQGQGRGSQLVPEVWSQTGLTGPFSEACWVFKQGFQG